MLCGSACQLRRGMKLPRSNTTRTLQDFEHQPVPLRGRLGCRNCPCGLATCSSFGAHTQQHERTVLNECSVALTDSLWLPSCVSAERWVRCVMKQAQESPDKPRLDWKAGATTAPCNSGTNCCLEPPSLEVVEATAAPLNNSGTYCCLEQPSMLLFSRWLRSVDVYRVVWAECVCPVNPLIDALVA